MKIKYQISFVFLALCVFLITALSISFFYSGKEILLNEVSNDLDVICNEKKLLVEDILNRKYRLATLIATDRSITRNLYNYSKSSSNIHKRDVDSSLNDYRNALEEIDKVNLFTLKNKLIASSNTQNLDTSYMRPANLPIVKMGSIYKTFFFKGSDERLKLSVLVPVMYNSRQIGIVEVEHEAKDLVTLVQDTTGLGATGESFIIDKANRTYLTPTRFDSSTLFQKIQDSSILYKKNGTWIIKGSRDKNELFSSKDIDGQDWEVIAKMDLEEVLEPIEKLRGELIVFYILAISLAVLFSFLLAAYLTEPLKILIEYINKIAKGNFSGRVNIKQKNEIGILADSFNTMASRLENTITELYRSNEDLNKYAYVITHDLKSPLHSLSGLNQIIKEEYKDKIDQEGQKLFDMQQEKINQMHSLIEGVLESSKHHKVKIKENLEVKKIIDEIVEDLEFPESIQIIVHESFPTIQYPKVALIQIYQNLIGNAIKYMDKPKGRIELGFKEREAEYEFYVKDNGPGIKKEDFKRIFIMFEAINTQRADSTGIGLSIVKKIIEDNGGKIWLESQPGQGTSFFFTIPQ